MLGLSGANDNALGTAVLLAVAEMLTDVDLPFTLRIVPFGSEELGLLGSRFDVQELSSAELENTKLMLNFDALSTGSGVAIFGDGVFTDLINEKGSEVGVDARVSRGMRGGTSDFAVFREAGVPFVTTPLGFTPSWIPSNSFSPRCLAVLPWRRRRCFSLRSSRS